MLIKIKQFLKQYWLFVLLATVASLLLVLRLSQRGQPSPPPTLQPTPPPQPSLTPPQISGLEIPLDTKFAIADLSLPSRLKTYQGVERKISSVQAAKIARELGFSGSPQKSEDVLLGNFYTWSSKTHFLTIALDANMVDYGLDLYQASLPAEGTFPSPEKAKIELKSLLAKLELIPQFEPKWQKEEYLVKGFYFLPAPSLEEAEFIKVGFNPAIGQYQLVGLYPNEPMVSLLLGKNNEVIRFRYQIYFSNFEGKEVYELKTETGVRTTINTEGKIVLVAGSPEKTARGPEITQAEFNQIKLAYFQETEKNLLIQPIYILSGQGILASGEETEIIAYLPAIKFETQAPLRLPEFFK